MFRSGRIAMVAFALSALLHAAQAAPVCVGDCNDDGEVTIDELLRGVNVALGSNPLSDCPSFDRDADSSVTVDELVLATNAALLGCTTTPTPNATATASPTPSVNHAPIITAPAVYRAYPGFAVAAPIVVTDPDGDAVQCVATALPNSAQFDGTPGTLRWTPATAQVGPAYLRFTCTDNGTPSASANGVIPIVVQSLDSCINPVCDPAAGCSSPPAALDAPCCTTPAAPFDEPEADCPAGLVLLVSEAFESGFQTLHDCDLKSVITAAQSSAQVRMRVRTRCISLDDRARVRTRLESKNRTPLFDREYLVRFNAGPGGYLESPVLALAINPPSPFFDIEGSEANLTVTLRDAQNQQVSQSLRVRLTFTPVPTPAM